MIYLEIPAYTGIKFWWDWSTQSFRACLDSSNSCLMSSSAAVSRPCTSSLLWQEPILWCWSYDGGTESGAVGRQHARQTRGGKNKLPKQVHHVHPRFDPLNFSLKVQHVPNCGAQTCQTIWIGSSCSPLQPQLLPQAFSGGTFSAQCLRGIRLESQWRVALNPGVVAKKSLKGMVDSLLQSPMILVDQMCLKSSLPRFASILSTSCRKLVL